jgi:hypothetical protein
MGIIGGSCIKGSQMRLPYSHGGPLAAAIVRLEVKMDEVERTTLDRRTWKVIRYGSVDEVQMKDGSIRYHVQVQDAGRPPFMTQWFNEESRANDFLDKVLKNANDVVRIT